jgi:hypothetical protein
MGGDFIDSVLSVGRYVHGSRSIEALVEMATRPDSKTFEVEHVEKLHKAKVLDNHVDLGLLGRLVIALSAGGEKQDGAEGYDPRLDEVLPQVATRLLEHGAGLVYGGGVREGGFTHRLAEAYARLPKPLIRTNRLAPPLPARVTWVGTDKPPVDSNQSVADRVDVLPAPCLSKDDLVALGFPEGLGRVLGLFRRRALITRSSNARLVFGGKVSGFEGRFPGIAEEVMLRLAARAPVYVCGGFESAARDVGQLLGMGDPWSTLPDSLRSDKLAPDTATLEAAVKACGRHFQLPHRGDLPLDYEGLVQFLRDHAVDGPRWPDNGLTPEENRALFRSTDANEIFQAVKAGLRRRFVDTP